MRYETKGKRNIDLGFDIPENKELKIVDNLGENQQFIVLGGRKIHLTSKPSEYIDVELVDKPIQMANNNILQSASAFDVGQEVNAIIEKQNAIKQAFAEILVFKNEIDRKLAEHELLIDGQVSELGQKQELNKQDTDSSLIELSNGIKLNSSDIQNIYSLISDLNQKAIDTDFGLKDLMAVLNKHEHPKATKESIGLGKVDNTSDIDKPISKATQEALDTKASIENINDLVEKITKLQKKQKDFQRGIDSLGGMGIGTVNLEGGKKGYVLVKKSDQNGDFEWSPTAGGGVTIHNELTGRSASNAHPISSITGLQQSLTDESTNRENADIGLQRQIDAITASSDVKDIVGTYAQLQAYDTSTLGNNDIIKVLQDETQDDETTYYRWSTSTETFTLIGAEGPYYTKSEADSEFVPQTRTVNGKALSSDISLTYSDVGALPDNTTIGDATLTIQKNGTTIDTFTANATSNKTVNVTVPTDTSDLTNGAGFLTNTNDCVHISGVETMTSAKKIFANDEVMAGNQAAVFATISNSNSGNSTWIGRYICGAKNLTFLMGTYNNMAGLGAHSWTNAQTGSGASWADFYLNPDGDKTVYIGGNGWRAGSGWLKVKNSGNTGGKTQVNIGSISSATWKDVAYKGENISDFNNNSGYITGINSSDVTSALGYTPLSNATKYGADLSYSSNTLQLLDQDGNNLGNAVTIGSVLPTQTGQSGKFLTTDGTDASWATVDASTVGALPDTTTASDIGGANKDLSNLTSTGKNIGNWSSNVTNCVTYIPQDVNLELSGGVLTLKAGSKVYFPDGFESDGVTRKFIELVSENDVSWSTSTTAGYRTAMASRTDDSVNGLAGITHAYVYSGSNSVMESTTPQTYSRFYNTDTNKMYAGSGGSWVEVNYSLPVGTFTNDNTGTVTSLDEIFNGFGYMNRTNIIYKGVKMLFPDGFNPDGTYKSKEFTTDNVYIANNGPYTTQHLNFVMENGLATTGYRYFEQETSPNVTYSYWYKPSENKTYKAASTTTYSPVDAVMCTYFDRTSGDISNFIPRKVFQALDYNDSDIISGWAMPSTKYITLTFGASGTSYTAPGNGYFVFVKTSGIANAYINANKASGSTFYKYAISTSARNNEALGFMIPVRKGDDIIVSYNATGTAYQSAVFVYAEGEV